MTRRARFGAPIALSNSRAIDGRPRNRAVFRCNGWVIQQNMIHAERSICVACWNTPSFAKKHLDLPRIWSRTAKIFLLDVSRGCSQRIDGTRERRELWPWNFQRSLETRRERIRALRKGLLSPPHRGRLKEGSEGDLTILVNCYWRPYAHC